MEGLGSVSSSSRTELLGQMEPFEETGVLWEGLVWWEDGTLFFDGFRIPLDSIWGVQEMDEYRGGGTEDPGELVGRRVTLVWTQPRRNCLRWAVGPIKYSTHEVVMEGACKGVTDPLIIVLPQQVRRNLCLGPHKRSLFNGTSVGTCLVCAFLGLILLICVTSDAGYSSAECLVIAQMIIPSRNNASCHIEYQVSVRTLSNVSFSSSACDTNHCINVACWSALEHYHVGGSYPCFYRDSSLRPTIFCSYSFGYIWCFVGLLVLSVFYNMMAYVGWGCKYCQCHCMGFFRLAVYAGAVISTVVLIYVESFARSETHCFM